MTDASSKNQRFLKDELQDLPEGLAAVLEAISKAAVDISKELAVVSADYTGTPNQFGDSQLMADVRTDEIIHNRLIESGCVETAPSEECPNARGAQGNGYCVAFDPLDGSSIFKSNFAVGTILGIWKGSTPIGQTGRDQAAAAYAIYGPKTLLVIARPTSKTDVDVKVQEFVLISGSWCLRRDDIKINEEKICAPANFRAAADSPQYQALMQHWMENHYVLRYSGAMVSDIHNILTAGGGVYCFPSSDASPTRLRLMYECAPMAYIVEAAGGAAYNDNGNSLDQPIKSYDDKSTIYIGSKALADDCQSRFQK